MKHEFELNIEMENDAMLSHEDVADALESVVRRIRKGESSGKILDQNGNRVGSFSLPEEG